MTAVVDLTQQSDDDNSASDMPCSPPPKRRAVRALASDPATRVRATAHCDARLYSNAERNQNATMIALRQFAQLGGGPRNALRSRAAAERAARRRAQPLLLVEFEPQRTSLLPWQRALGSLDAAALADCCVPWLAAVRHAPRLALLRPGEPHAPVLVPLSASTAELLRNVRRAARALAPRRKRAFVRVDADADDADVRESSRAETDRALRQRQNRAYESALAEDEAVRRTRCASRCACRT